MIPYNKLLSLSDFDFLHGIIRDIHTQEAEENERFPKGREQRKQWEQAQAYRTIADHVPTNQRQRVLGVGAGIELTSFALTRIFDEVHATDLYVEDQWNDWAQPAMLQDPRKVFDPIKACWTPARMIVQNMDGRDLRYPDDHFDAVYCTSSVEHFGSDEDIQQSVKEMVRVLRPGGILSIITEYKLEGTGDGWDHTRLMSDLDLYHLLIEPSGCPLLDELQIQPDEETLKTVQPLELAGACQQMGIPVPCPHLVLSYNGYKFTSVSLAFQKPYAVEVMEFEQFVAARLPIAAWE